MEIRFFKEGDETDCSKLLIKAFDWYLKIPGADWMYNKISPEAILRNSKEGVSLVAIDNGRIISYINFTISDYKTAYISVIGVNPDFSSLGVGSRILSEAESVCKRLKVRKIWLMVSHINYSGIKFYLKNGYHIEGSLKDMTIDGIDEIIMAKKL